ncbi:Hsp33 family molecular chaperone HslO [Methylophaga sp. OBS4]|uniref:Hsp33 family molecular chaperone HslO n=1 Tax=Methylophaga sp. OBS4 TaxID=2991935 RepID=UPI002257255B|nr:Hsp33 family molecular chaperone HslO [Methylophaga sp. OBS4]MCX4186658.1 Hsp33 family molecular chaperone HslO [Methylophaga sp. OBS4]
MSGATLQSDLLQRFLFDNAPIRGEWVNLQECWQEVLLRHDYPPAIRRVLGEMMAAAALLTETVKISGRLVLQIRSKGPVSLMMVECTSEHTLRAFAQWQGHVTDDAGLKDVTGDGTLAITIEMEDAKQPYQGVVSLQDDSIANTLETYFEQSEQLATRIWLSASDHAASGLLLQQLPSEEKQKHETEEHWSRISQLAATVTDDELLNLDIETLLHRLFHEEQVRLFEPASLAFACTCSRSRVAETISLLGKQEAEQILDEQGEIEVACEFCNEHYHFDKVDVTELFIDTVSAESDPNTLH